MKLSDRDIWKHIQNGKIKIDPAPSETMVNGASIDLRLGCRFRVSSMHATSHIDLGTSRAEIDAAINKVMGSEIVIDETDVFYLHPGELVLGVTAEWIELADDLCGMINGRSSLARLGLMVHSTAHFVDPGWAGVIVLEFYNCGRLPLGLRPNMAVCAITFEPLSSPAKRPYRTRRNAKYANQDGATASRIGHER